MSAATMNEMDRLRRERDEARAERDALTAHVERLTACVNAVYAANNVSNVAGFKRLIEAAGEDAKTSLARRHTEESTNGHH